MSETHLRQFRRFAQYNAWFNDQLYGRVETLDPEIRRRDLGGFFGGIQATLGHILLGDRMWLGRFAPPAPENDFHFHSLEGAELVHAIGSLADELYPEWEALRGARSETDEVLRRFVAELRADHLDREFHYVNSKGLPFSAPLWHVVAHLFNHQTHHRGQVTTLLHQQGIDPGVTDFMVTSVMPEEAP